MTIRDLPAPLASLHDLALDLRWTWSHAGDDLWRSVDEKTWHLTRNPWFVLSEAPTGRLQELATDAAFLGRLAALTEERTKQLEQPARSTLRSRAGEIPRTGYFCMEFGLGEAVPLYAGGLGILAGDFLKAASDLGVPAVGVGILYQEGYFRQTLNHDGWQVEAYPYNDPMTMPIQPLRGPEGAAIRIPLELPGRTLWLRTWVARVGRVRLYLLDANDPVNRPVDRCITARLYGGGPEERLLQELVLGVAGWRLLRAIGEEPVLAHLNEGHAAFAVLERARQVMGEQGMSLAEALVATRAGNAFTTHTSVAAGFDRFDPQLVEHTLFSEGACFAGSGFSAPDVLALGRANVDDTSERFNMAYLAARGCAFVNGVSRLHGEVSRRIFAELFPRRPVAEVPIDHVTNGVHVPSWDSKWADELWTRACGKERWRGDVDPLGAIVEAIGDEDLWRVRSAQRNDLVGLVRGRVARHRSRTGSDPAAQSVGDLLDPAVLTLGFARRFAEYKRPNLLLRDPDRLARLLTDRARPVQLVIAGKAHPADDEGKRLIAEWIRFARRADVQRRVVFLEDYDITLAEELTQGADVWANTPRRPWEACGTSGMKVLVNGGLNLSECDGWWAEVDALDVGWGIRGNSDDEEARRLYERLEREVVPEFYDRDGSGIPRRWVSRMRASMSKLAPRFSANRMLGEYVEKVYVPAAVALQRRIADGARGAREIARLKKSLTQHWRDVRFVSSDGAHEGGSLRFGAVVVLGGVPAECVRVEVWADACGTESSVRLTMVPRGGAPDGGHRFEVSMESRRPASDFTSRVVAWHAEALPSDLPFICWQR